MGSRSQREYDQPPACPLGASGLGAYFVGAGQPSTRLCAAAAGRSRVYARRCPWLTRKNIFVATGWYEMNADELLWTHTDSPGRVGAHKICLDPACKPIKHGAKLGTRITQKRSSREQHLFRAIGRVLRSQHPARSSLPKYFGLSFEEARRRAPTQMLPCRVFRLGGQKSPWLVSAFDLAELIDRRRGQAAKSPESPRENRRRVTSCAAGGVRSRRFSGRRFSHSA